jgi:hypothetical protein
VVTTDEELANDTERYLFDQGCQVLRLQAAGPESVPLVAELLRAGFVVILNWSPDRSLLPEVPFFEPSEADSVVEIWAGLSSKGGPKPVIGSCGEGI